MNLILILIFICGVVFISLEQWKEYKQKGIHMSLRLKEPADKWFTKSTIVSLVSFTSIWVLPEEISTKMISIILIYLLVLVVLINGLVYFKTKQRLIVRDTVIMVIICFIGIFTASVVSAIDAPTSPPEIKITINEREIPYTIQWVRWREIKFTKGGIPSRRYFKNTDFDTKDIFDMILENKEEDFQTVNLGNIIDIRFLYDPPQSLTLSDSLIKINEEGSPSYIESNVMMWEIESKNGQLQYEIQPHLGYTEGNYVEEFQEGEMLRAYKLTARWGKSECEYAFILNVDE